MILEKVRPPTATSSNWDIFALKCGWRYKLPAHMLRFVLVALCAQIDWAKAHMGHGNPNYGKWLKSPHNTNHWDSKSPISTQCGAVGGQI
eukprot:1150812-Pelagomonas_calceolata.AAC.3